MLVQVVVVSRRRHVISLGLWSPGLFSLLIAFSIRLSLFVALSRSASRLFQVSLRFKKVEQSLPADSERSLQVYLFFSSPFGSFMATWPSFRRYGAMDAKRGCLSFKLIVHFQLEF